MDREQEIRRFFLLQVNDALFPIGGYSHSQGLETYIQQGSVCDEKTAAEYIHKKLRFALAYTDLLAVRLAWELADQNDADGLDELEEILGASRIPFEQREASRKMGSRFAKTIEKLHAETMPMKNREIFEAYLDARDVVSLFICTDFRNGNKLCQNYPAQSECRTAAFERMLSGICRNSGRDPNLQRR